MTLKNKIPVLIFLLFIAFVFVIVYKQKVSWNKIYDSELKGIVISAEEGNKGYWHIVFGNGEKRSRLSFSYANSSIRVNFRDSIFKAANSDIFFVKKYETLTLVKLELLGFH
jgi:hypothetical protein